MEYKYDVFISYSRRDYVDAKGNVLPDSPVTKIREAFDHEGISYWFDEEGIYSSEEFMRKIVQAIAESKMLVFISSKASNESPWTAGEILEALEGKKAILPVKIDNSRYNDSFRLPLLPLDYIDYRKNPKRSIDRLLVSVMAKVGKGKDKKPGIVRPEPAPVDKSHIGRYVSIVACAVGVIICILMLMNRVTPTPDPTPSPNPEPPVVDPSPQPVPTPPKPVDPHQQDPVPPKLVLVSGTVTDETTGKPVVGAQVKSSDGNLETTDRNGKYSFTGGVEENAKLSVVYDSKTWKTRVVKKAGTYDFKLPLPVKTEPIATSTSGSSHTSTTSASGRSSNTTATTPGSKIHGHDYVDLGLSVKWATCNVGATSPSDYGNYYAWGEVSTKSEYTESNSKTYKKGYGNIGGNSSTDAARANWGGTWRLPTKSELEELKSNCTWSWTTMNGKNGYRVTGRNGNSIFLPAAGYRNGSSLIYAGSGGYYWSSTPREGNTDYAYYLYFYSDYHRVRWSRRYDGFSVRPVSE